MVGLTTKKASHSRVRQKCLTCTIQLQIHAITCPGVLLHSQEDVYLSVRMMGQYCKTKCVPSAFPLLLHEKMLFSKIFSGAFDPADIAEHLENDTTCFELIQLVPPVTAGPVSMDELGARVESPRQSDDQSRGSDDIHSDITYHSFEGEILATFEENTRDFLYPGPKLIPQSPGSGREILMKKSISFPGISPKVEFSTMSVIEKCDVKPSQSACSPITTTPAHPRTSATTVNKVKTRTAPPCGYQRHTVASQSRSPSPYTRRKMCQLSEEAIQRLHHLQLGPFTFKKELSTPQPFVVPCSPNSSLIEHSTLTSLSAVTSSPKMTTSHRKSASADSTGASYISPVRNSTRFSSSSPSYMRTPVHHSSPVSSKQSVREQSSLLRRSTLRERFQSPCSPSQSEEIHSRVQRILHTQATRRRLSFEKTRMEQEIEPLGSSDNLFNDQFQPKRVPTEEPSVHLDNGTFWSNQKAIYTGKSHREVFEDSLGKIYKHLYKNHISSKTQ